MKTAILRDHNPESSYKWELACEKKEIDYIVVNLLRNDWIDTIVNYNPDFCLSRPPGDIQLHKKIFDEKLFYLKNYYNYPIYPDYLETIIYENKSSLNWFLKSNNIPSANTFVSAFKEECLQFALNTKYPIIGKTLIGAGGSGVVKINSHEDAISYINLAFGRGIKRRFGPNKNAGNAVTWISKALKSPKFLINKLSIYSERHKDSQKNMVLFQEFIEHDYEWRSVKIGESYFAYKKLKIGDKASGSKQFAYGFPPDSLFDFTKNICDRFGFEFMAIDVFENGKGNYLVNELQTIFGHKNENISFVNNVPGRFIYENEKWVFEPGNFNTNESFDLRLATAINLFKSNF